MKILTLNTHSLIENNYHQKLESFVNAIKAEKPEIIALQEVNQTLSEPFCTDLPYGYFPCRSDIIIRADNHAFRTADLLKKSGEEYFWTWHPIKKGYGKYEEGLSLLSRSPIIETKIIPISSRDDYENWKTRKLLGIRTEKLSDEWFFSVHYGWWNDSEEPFEKQWHKTEKAVSEYETVWLMGDFNNPAEVRNEGYDLIKGSYWHDSFILAEKRDGDITVGGEIDGWRDEKGNKDGMRIDQIWCSKKTVVTSYRVIFDGKSYPVVSDHYGVIINYERSIV